MEGHSQVARGGDIAALQPPCLLLLSPYLITTLAGLHVGDCPPHYRPHSSLTQGHTPFPSPPPSTPKGVEHCSGGERGEDTERCRVGDQCHGHVLEAGMNVGVEHNDRIYSVDREDGGP